MIGGCHSKKVSMLKLPAGTDSMLWIINHTLLLSEPHSFINV